MLLLGSATTGMAQDNDDNRYELQPSGDGVVRLDRKTGQMSFCTTRDDQLVCRLAADEREAYEAEIRRLEERLDALEPDRQDGEAPPKTSDRLVPTPDAAEREFQKAMKYAERAMRHFFDVMENLRDDWEKKRELR